MVGANPLRERLRGQLILALYRSGRQAEALETFRETRRVLVEELGIDPSPELRELERAILRQDPALVVVRPPAAPPSPGAEAPLSRWRWPRSPLVIGVGLLLLAGGATAGAVLATTGGTSQPGTVTASSRTLLAAQGIPALGPGAANFQSAGQVPAQRSTRRVRRTAPQRPAGHPQKPKSGPRPPAAHPPPASEPAPPPPPPPQQPPPQPPPPPKKKPPPPPFVYWLADNFHDPAFDHNLWDFETNGSGVAVAERNDRLEFAIDPGGVPNDAGIDAHYSTNCFVEGDFEAIVQYQLLTWPEMDGMNVGLGAWTPPPHSEWLGVVRAGSRSDGAPECISRTCGRARRRRSRRWAREGPCASGGRPEFSRRTTTTRARGSGWAPDARLPPWSSSSASLRRAVRCSEARPQRPRSTTSRPRPTRSNARLDCRSRIASAATSPERPCLDDLLSRARASSPFTGSRHLHPVTQAASPRAALQAARGAGGPARGSSSAAPVRAPARAQLPPRRGAPRWPGPRQGPRGRGTDR